MNRRTSIMAIHMLCALAAVLGVAAPAMQAEEPVTFEKLATKEKVTTIALWEDGSLLLAACEEANLVSVWDTRTGKHVRDVDVTSPRSLMVRGGRLFVGGGDGTLRVLSGKTWQIEDSIEVSKSGIAYLSAGVGEDFRGKLLADCRAGGKFLVSVDQKSVVASQAVQFPGPDYPISLAADGERIIASYQQWYAGSLQVGERNVTSDLLGRNPHGEVAGLRLMPDMLRPLFYAIQTDRLECRKLSNTLAPLGSRSLSLPAWTKVYMPGYTGPGAKRNTAGTVFPIRWSNYSTREEKTGTTRWYHVPIAATVGDSLYLFLVDPRDRQVWRAVTRRFDDAPASQPSSAPAGTCAFQPMDTPDLVSSFALTEGGEYLLLAFEKANRLAVHQVRTGKQVAELSCPCPRFILCRKGSIFVASCGKGTIAVFDAKTWKFRNALNVDANNVYRLSAPGGRFFRDQLLAFCDDLSQPRMFVVDTAAGKCAKWSGRMDTPEQWWTLTYRGDAILGTHGKGLLNRDLQEPRWQPGVPLRSSDRRPYLAQYHDLPIWVGGDSIWSETPILRLFEPDGARMAVPDVVKSVAYVFYDDRVVCRRLDAQATALWAMPAEKPPQLHGAKWSPVKTDQAIWWADSDPCPMFAPPVSATHDDRMYAFVMGEKGVVYRAEANVPTTDGVTSGQFPASVTIGTPVRHRLALSKPGGAFTVLTGPSGMRVDTSGVLTWTPSKDELGRHNVKIRVDGGEEPQFIRFDVSVVADAVALAADSADVSKLPLLSGPWNLSVSRDGKNVLLLCGHELTFLDAEGLHAVRTVKLDQSYREVFDRPNYYLCLADNEVSLVDKTTLQPTGRIVIPGKQLTQLAVHPTELHSYAAVVSDEPAVRGTLQEFQIVRVDEVRKTAKPVTDAYGQALAVDAQRRLVYASLHDTYRKGFAIDSWGGLWEVRGSNLRIVTYAISGEGLKPVKVTNSFADKAERMTLSPDGRILALMRREGTCSFLDAGEPNKILAQCWAGGHEPGAEWPAMHPSLPLFAQATEKGVNLTDFSKNDLSGKLDDEGDRIYNPRRVMFSPSGNHLLVICQDSRERLVLRSLAVRLAAEEIAILGKARPPGPGPSPTPAPAATPRRPAVAAADLDSLTAAPSVKKMAVKDIAQKFSNSTVLISRGQALATGIIVGAKGYVLTAANVLGDGEVTVSYRLLIGGRVEMFDARAEVLRVDERSGLALLKIATKAPLPAVPIARGAVELGEEVAVIAHPALGADRLNFTVTEGVVSAVSRTIGKTDFVQTSAAVDKGSGGAPVFDSMGRVIGVIMLKGNIEKASFALPADSVRAFLKACTAPEGAPFPAESTTRSSERARP